MRIKQVLNHNVIITNREGKEVIAMGKGIAFGKRAGEEIDETKVEKFFVLENNERKNQFAQLLVETPEHTVELARQMIDYIKMNLSKKVSDSIYFTLIDHINSLEERAKLNAYIRNTMLWDIKKLYKDEFEISMHLVNEINKKFNSSFDENEAANLTMHIVNSENDVELSVTVDITKVITEILNLVKYYFKVIFDEDSLSYYRFVTHLRFFALRLFTDTTYEDDDSLGMLDTVKEQYPEYIECTYRIRDYLKKMYRYDLCDEECLYLTLHIIKVVKGSKKI